MLAYLRRAIELWRRYPLALTAPLLIPAWLFSLVNVSIQHLSRGLRVTSEVGVFLLFCVISYAGHAFLSRIVCDVAEGNAPDWRGAIALCRQSYTFRVGLSLSWRLVLWLIVALLVGLLFEGVVYALFTMAHHPLAHGALRRPFIWVAMFTLTACVAKYSYTFPYLAFSRGVIPKPISLSIARTEPILRPLIWLTICGAATALTISEIFRLTGLHLRLTPETKLAWDLLRDAMQSVPNAWLVIAVTLIAFQDWLALKEGNGLQVDDSQPGQYSVR